VIWDNRDRRGSRPAGWSKCRCVSCRGGGFASLHYDATAAGMATAWAASVAGGWPGGTEQDRLNCCFEPGVGVGGDRGRPPGRDGQALGRLFGCMYYSALRPSEAVPLTETGMHLPREGWGEFRLRESTPMSGPCPEPSGPTPGRSRDRRQLKHRPRGDVRVVPIPPPLTDLLRHHLREFGTTPCGRLFPAVRGGLLGGKLYGDTWRAARQTTLTPAEAASPLARARMTSRTRPCPPGSTPGSIPPWWPRGRATASRSCCRSTPSA
jgi:hypothetical protein